MVFLVLFMLLYRKKPLASHSGSWLICHVMIFVSCMFLVKILVMGNIINVEMSMLIEKDLV
jgi:hypothetical protein